MPILCKQRPIHRQSYVNPVLIWCQSIPIWWRFGANPMPTRCQSIANPSQSDVNSNLMTFLRQSVPNPSQSDVNPKPIHHNLGPIQYQSCVKQPPISILCQPDVNPMSIQCQPLSNLPTITQSTVNQSNANPMSIWCQSMSMSTHYQNSSQMSILHQ